MPTLVIPITSEEQYNHVYRAEGELMTAGVLFDSSYDTDKNEVRWEFDYSLKGAKLIEGEKVLGGEDDDGGGDSGATE